MRAVARHIGRAGVKHTTHVGRGHILFRWQDLLALIHGALTTEDLSLRGSAPASLFMATITLALTSHQRQRVAVTVSHAMVSLGPISANKCSVNIAEGRRSSARDLVSLCLFVVYNDHPKDKSPYSESHQPPPWNYLQIQPKPLLLEL